MAGLLWLAISPAGSASTLYVATSGSDTNSGLSEAAAFRTLQKAVNVVAPGDTILMLPGTYAGARIETSGTSNAPITLRPATPGTVTLDRAGPSSPHQSVIEIETFGAPAVVRYWTIENLRVVNSLRYGIDARSTQFLVMRGNTVSNSASTGIFTAFSYDALIESNACSFNREHGIYYNNSSDRFVIRGNTLHHNRHAGLHLNADFSIAPPAGSGWVHDGAISDGLIENNIIYANGQGGAGINMDGVQRSLVRNNIIYNSTNNSGIALFRQDAAIASRWNRILNNTIIMGANNGGWAINLSSPGCFSNELINNITHSFHGFRGSISLFSSNLVGLVSDYNSLENTFSINNGGSTIQIAQWRALGYDPHSMIANPTILVVNVTNDLRLRPTGPAIDAGTARTDVPVDLLGVSRPLDGFVDGSNEWDIGAYEFVSVQGDSDHDGSRDADEVLAGTDATNPLSRLELTATEVPENGGPVVRWSSVAGLFYTLQQATNLTDSFSTLATSLPATPPINVYTTALTATATYFRVTLDSP